MIIDFILKSYVNINIHDNKMTSILTSRVFTSFEYNNLPGVHHVSDKFDTELLEEIGAIFIKHNVQEVFSLHRLHTHRKIEKGAIMLQTKIAGTSHYLVKAVHPETLNKTYSPLNCIVLADGTLQAYSYSYDDINVRNKYESFLKEFSEYILKNRLERTFSLTINRGDINIKYAEFESVDNTCSLEKPAEADDKGTISNWIFKEEDGKIKPIVNDEHAETTHGTHRVFVS